MIEQGAEDELVYGAVSVGSTVQDALIHLDRRPSRIHCCQLAYLASGGLRSVCLMTEVPNSYKMDSMVMGKQKGVHPLPLPESQCGHAPRSGAILSPFRNHSVAMPLEVGRYTIPGTTLHSEKMKTEL